MGAEGLGVLLVGLGIGVLGHGEEVLERGGFVGGKGIGKERTKEGGMGRGVKIWTNRVVWMVVDGLGKDVW